jgi:hypothetical protein
MSITNEITELAGKYAAEYGFSAKSGGSIEIVAGSERATSAASDILASLGQVTHIARESALGSVVAAAASVVALGDLNPAALGVGAMAGVISSISKGRS